MTGEPASSTDHVRTVARTLVHRRAVSEVFVTDLAADGGGFIVGVQLPRWHAYYNDHVGSLAPLHDPLVVMESARQGAMALTHRFLDVPLNQAFRVQTFNFAARPGDSWQLGSTPADLEMRVRVAGQHTHKEVLRGVDLVLDIAHAGTPRAVVDGSFSWVSREQWAASRAAYRKSLGLGPFHAGQRGLVRAPAAAVARHDHRNVVLGPPDFAGTRARAAIVADQQHPFLFDHPLDHVPGSLLIEAGRQLSLALQLYRGAPLIRVKRITSAFSRFVELDLPAECVATIVVSGPHETLVHNEIHQAGAVAAEIDVTLGPLTGEAGP